MSSLEVPMKLDLSFAERNVQEDHPGLVKETSTVGDLISFTERNKRQSPVVRRNSLTDVRTLARGCLRRRSDSFGSSFRLSSASVSSPTKGFNEESDTENASPPPKGRHTSRRESMLNLLREDLQKIPCLEALRRHPSRNTENDYNEVFSVENSNQDSGSEDDRSSPRKYGRFSRRNSRRSYGRRDSRRSTADHVTISEADMRKFQMLHALNKMSVQTKQNTNRMSPTDIQTGEVAILEASYGAGRKRGSISTRLLLKASRTNETRLALSERTNVTKPLKILPKVSNDKTVQKQEEELSESKPEKSQKILGLLKNLKPKSTSMLPAIGSQDKLEPTKTESIIKESFAGLRRKIRRKKESYSEQVIVKANADKQVATIAQTIHRTVKMRPVEIFRKRAKFIVLLLRAWKIHSNAINESLIANNDSLDMMTRANNTDLMFDITKFKAVKEAKVSQEAKRILMKKPSQRTEDEKHYIQVFLRNYKSIAEYPVKMQKMIAERSWYENYDIKRVLVREGHVPMCFYFLLSGSAVVSTMENDVPRTVMFLNRGDSFGDVAILNNSRRQTTVISREKIELLCMSDTDFTDIFMSGGLRDPNDPFLKSINFLDGWPREKLIDNPKKCIFSYFKRGTVLVSDSSTNDWIFVIKSGSASILKKLQTVDMKKNPKLNKPRDLREEVLEYQQHETYLSHEEQVQLMFEEEKRTLDDQNLHVRFYALPEINVKTNESYNELRQMKEEFINANSINRVLGSLEKMADAGADVKSEIANSDSTAAASKRSLRKKSVGNVLLKGPFLHKGLSGVARENSFVSQTSRRGSTRNSQRSSGSGQKHTPDDDQVDPQVEENKRKVDDWQGMSLPSLAASPLNDLRIVKAEPKPVFVEVQCLTKGQIFGLTDMLFDNQPHFSLVSNGTECIMIEKKFYLEFVSQKLMVSLRENTYPYPGDDALQDNLESQLRWDHQRNKILSNQWREVKMKKSDKYDARSTLMLPPLLKV